MFIFFCICYIFFSNFSFSEDFKLFCIEDKQTYYTNLSSSFSKIINFEDQTLNDYSGGFFDKVILFGKNEIILINDIFDTRSTFNIKTSKWTIYKGQFIKIYGCTKEKRRF